MRKSDMIATCGMTAALSVVIMVVGGILGLGMYISPMIAGLCLLPIGRKYGVKYQWSLWAAVSLLCLILVPNVEENLMYISLFGLYPILYPGFERLPKRLRWICKFLYFNMVVVAVEALIMLVLVPETLGLAMNLILLALGNFTFLCYDFLIPRWELLLQRYFGKRKKP